MGTRAGGVAATPHPAAHTASENAAKRLCLAAAFVIVGLFLFAIARFYQPGYGFTALIGFPSADGLEPAALGAVPHYQYPTISYDGQFYATRALDPLLRNPAIDSEMDLPPLRARRILFSWTAYVMGLGRPVWILNAYALQNVAAWLLLAIVLGRWASPTAPRRLAVWAACLLSHGMMWSVRLALLDGPSLVLIAIAVRLVEDERPLASAAVAGIAGLGRETNVLAVLAQPFPRRAHDWLGALLVVAPLLVWLDYLRSIYRSTLFTGSGGDIGLPGVGLARTAAAVWHLVRTAGLFSAAGLQICILAPLLVQAAFLVVRPRWTVPWWRVAAGYAALLMVLQALLWMPSTGAVSRVMLPLTVGFNILLIRDARARFWPWFIAGNLHVIPALVLMPLFSRVSL
jgi:hypothetical protein